MDKSPIHIHSQGPIFSLLHPNVVQIAHSVQIVAQSIGIGLESHKIRSM